MWALSHSWTYAYDALSRLKRVDSGQAELVLYTAGGERIWSIFEPGNLLQPLAETFSLLVGHADLLGHPGL